MRMRERRGREGNTTESNRTSEYRATTCAERARSSVGAKIGSSSVVNTHKYRNRAGFALVFFARHQRKPVRFGRAARFARVECEVRKIQKPKIFGGRIFWRGGLQSLCAFAPPTHAHAPSLEAKLPILCFLE